MAHHGETNGIATYATESTPDGTSKGVGITSDYFPEQTAHAGDAQSLKDARTLLKPLPAYTPRKLRIITIGAGYSGLTLAHKFQHQHTDLADVIDHTIYEVRSELGGTWLVNTYPGVVCDVPSHIYVRAQRPRGLEAASLMLTSDRPKAFPFDPNPSWTRFFSTGPEIWAYMKKTAQKWNLERDVKYNHRVTGAYWQEDRGQWQVMVEHDNTIIEDYADILISAQGFLK